MNIYLDESLKGLGSSTLFVWANADGLVSLGRTNSYAAPFQKVILISFNFGVTLHGGPLHVGLFKARHERKEEVDFMWGTLFEALTPALFKELMRCAKKNGVHEGESQLREQLKKLLHL